jgi:hypothetical protein
VERDHLLIFLPHYSMIKADRCGDIVEVRPCPDANKVFDLE